MADLISKNLSVERTRRKSQPLYEQIRGQIHEMIKSGSLEEGSRLPSISALSERLRVNYRTVKSALDLLEKDGVVSCEPNRGAVVVKNGSTACGVAEDIAISFLRLTGDAFSMSLSAGIKKFAAEHDVECVFIDGGGSHERFVDAIVHPGNGVKGLLVTPLELPEHERAVREAIGNGTKVVFVDRVLPNLHVSCVSADHFMGAYEATCHLLETHERPVYHIGNVTELSSCRERLRGWRAAMHAYNHANCDDYAFDIEINEANLANSGLDHLEYETRHVAQFFEKRDDDVFSVFASNDYSARAVYEVARRRGLKIGEDVFVVGFGNLPLASRLPVPLSSVEQNSEQVGFEAARILYDAIVGAQHKPVNRVLPVNLIVRQSSVGSATPRH